MLVSKVAIRIGASSLFRGTTTTTASTTTTTTTTTTIAAAAAAAATTTTTTTIRSPALQQKRFCLSQTL